MKLIIFAGPNGSGKSTVVAEVLKQYPGMLYICPDDYLKKLYKEKAINTFDEDAYIKNYKKACDKAEEHRLSCIENGDSFAMETVFSKREKLRFVQYALEKGYSVEVYYITTSDPSINIDRVKIRESQGGHTVPAEKIISRYYESMELLPEIIEIEDVIVTAFDNSEFNEGPKAMLHKDKKGNVSFFNCNQRPNWCEKLKDKLSSSQELTVRER